MRALLLDGRGQPVADEPNSLVQRWSSDPDSFIWVDLQEVSDAQRDEVMLGVFGLHPLAVQDALRARHPPKVEIGRAHV